MVASTGWAGPIEDAVAAYEREDYVTDAQAITQGDVLSDFSYTNKKLVSDRVVRVCDAAGLIDPIFSSGVMLAMHSAQEGARVVDEALKAGRMMTFAMKRYEWSTRKHVGRFWQFIEKFYTKHFAQLFFQPSNKFRMVCAINCVLAGRPEMNFANWWRLKFFFGLVWIQKRVALAKPIEIG